MWQMDQHLYIQMKIILFTEVAWESIHLWSDALACFVDIFFGSLDKSFRSI